MFKFKRISTKITVAIVAVGIIMAGLIGGIVGNQVSTKFKAEAIEKAEITVEKNTRDFEKDFITIQTAVSTLGENIGSEFDLTTSKSDPTYLSTFSDTWAVNIKNLAENLNYTTSVYVYFNSEVFNSAEDVWFLKNSSGQYERQAKIELSYYDGDEKAKEWFYGPIRSKQARWTAPYTSEAGDLITSYVRPIMKNGEVIAIVGMDFNLNDVATKLDQVKLYDTGYLYMMDENYNFIVHPNVEIGANLKDFSGGPEAITEMNSKEMGYALVVKDGDSKIAGFARLGNGWIIASSIPVNEVTAIVSKIITIIIAIAIISLLVSIIIAYIVGKSISKPILQVTDTITNIKNGDFTVNAQVNSHDETKILAEGLNEMIATVKSLIGNAKLVSQNMADAASNLASMAEETSATSDEVARTVHEIAEGATDQAQDAEAGTRKASELDSMFKSLIEGSETMANNAETAMDVSKEGGQSLDQLKQKSQISKESNQNVANAIATLDEKANAISSIIGAITSIAEQTNLLALNASIEAARAGEAGRGFAVVADEIRKLAEDSSTAASEIQKIVIDIQTESKETVNIMGKVESISNEQNQAVDHVSDAIDKVFESINNISAQIKSVSDQVIELDVIKNEITSSIGNISAVSEETAAATEEVTASMEQQNMAVEEVAKSAEHLNELSIELSNQISQFKVD